MKASKALMLVGVITIFSTLATPKSIAQTPDGVSVARQHPASPAGQQGVISQPRSQAPQRPERIVVAIDKFDDTDGSSADDAAQLRERVLHRVVGTRKFEVVERADLKKVLSEIRHATAGLTDNSTAPEQGKLKAAGFVIYGKLLFCGADTASANMVGLATARERFRCEFQLKISDGETGRVLASKVVKGTAQQNSVGLSEVTVKGAASGNPLQRAATDQAAAFAVDALRELLYPARVVRVGGRFVTVNMTSTEVSLGEFFDVFEDAGEMYDPDTGASLGSEGEYLGRMKVINFGPKTSMLEPVGGLSIDRVRVGCLIRRVNKDILNAEKDQSEKLRKDRFESRF